MPNKMGRIYQYKNINIIDPAQPELLLIQAGLAGPLCNPKAIVQET